ncbi:hypothetical protein HYH02_010380 [Chlamydomonas schloesseri]|uniref:Guanylate cyclase domain-containing protein n=1 Tax=Chlamydomonas schloesseri TaxID=2026947 RepID=A0A835W4Q1_9CHLO|nr:hypothetical protein HYH02_010380 [Chlamydomonas schloesseri]|eukprot:KAG2440502.1 hypothetical protein HYH02_010380 [Chlamydomonas schloesseri]
MGRALTIEAFLRGPDVRRTFHGLWDSLTQARAWVHAHFPYPGGEGAATGGGWHARERLPPGYAAQAMAGGKAKGAHVTVTKLRELQELRLEGFCRDVAQLEQSDEAVKQALIQELTGTAACAAAFSATSADVTVVISWLRFPAWYNGAISSWLKEQVQSNPQIMELLHNAVVDDPDSLPALGSFSAGSMRDYLTVQQNQYSVVSMDVSGIPSWSVWVMLQEWDPFIVPENVCVNETEPRGLLHPRTYLSMFYRAEALAALAAGGHVPSAAPPDDWEQLIALLEAHRLATNGSSSGTGSSSSGVLPKYGLCITTHPDCGLLGDVWAAMAASVLQTQGTAQGYLYDLASGSPSSAIPMANGTGWVHATELLRRLLVYNAPGPIDRSASNRTTDRELECTDISSHFKAGDCMVTFDWDIMLGVMNTTQLLSPGVQLRVAPLPGSRTVMDRRAGSSTVGQLVPCDWELCGVSANHDLLYLGLQAVPPPSAAAVAAAAPELARARAAVAAAAQSLEAVAPVSALTDGNGGALPTRCDPSVTASIESAAVAQALAAARAQAPAAEALVNRAPYSACMMSANKYQSTASGVALSSRTFATVGEILGSFIDAAYVRRNVATVMARSNVGYPVDASGSYLSTATSANSSNIDSSDTLAADVSGANSTKTGPAGPDSGMLLYLRMRWWTALRESFNVSGFADTGLSNDTIQSYAQAVWHGLHAPNAAPDASSPSSVNFIKWGLARAAEMLIAPNRTSSAAMNASSTLQNVMYMVNEAFTERATRAMYESSVDYTPQHKTLGSEGSAKSSSMTISEEALAGLLVGLIVAVILSIVAIIAVALRMRRRNRDLLGRVRAPRAGPDTTLLISDIQNSTRLWEELSVNTMDAALKMHHAVFRKLMSAHDGYESATEGDSFIVAFPSPASALAFATACQLALLQQDWPQELLQHPDGAVVAVEARCGGEGIGGFKQSCRSPVKSVGELQAIGAARSWQPFCVFVSLWDRLSRRSSPGSVVGPGGGVKAAGDSERQLSGAALRTSNSGVAVPELPTPCMHQDSEGLDTCTYGRASMEERPSLTGAQNTDVDGALHNASPQQTISPQRTQPQLPPVVTKLPANAGAGGAEQGQGRDRDGSITSGAQFEQAEHTGRQAQATPAGSDADRFSRNSCSTIAATPGVQTGATPGGGTWGRVLALMYPLESRMSSGAGITASGAATPAKRLVKAAYASNPGLGYGGAKVTCFRGPRVRMGLHCGLDDGRHVVWNRVNCTFQYTGPFADTAKLVSDAAHGGLVTLSGAAFARYRNSTSTSSSGAAAHVPQNSHGIVIAYAGHHVLSEKAPAAASSKGGEVSAATNVSAEHVMLDLLRVGNGTRVAAQAAEAMLGEVPLFVAVPASLLCRLAHTPPLRTVRQVQLGSLAAPTGSVTIAFMKVVGAATLLTELPGPANRALDQFQRLACGLLMGPGDQVDACASAEFASGIGGGYLVEGGDGLVLAAFGSPLAAVEWALDTLEGLRKLAWEEELLSHELCEEVLTVSPATATTAAAAHAAAGAPSTLPAHAPSLHSVRVQSPSQLGPAGARPGATESTLAHTPASASPPHPSLMQQSLSNPQLADSAAVSLPRAGSTRVVSAAARRTTERGLRVKVGLDVGPVTYSLTESSGRLSYRGRVMNRAARIAGTASPGQVLCSGGVWAACEAGMAALPLAVGSHLVGVSLGKVALKGISAPVEIFQCEREG